MEWALVLLVIFILVIIPSFLFHIYNFTVQFFIFKPSHQPFLRSLKKTWWVAILWTSSIFGAFFTLSTLSDGMTMRIGSTLLILAILYGVNILYLKRMAPSEADRQATSKKPMAASYGLSAIIVLLTFWGNIPNKIINLKEKDEWAGHIAYISSCNTALKSINERGIMNGDLIHALYNESERELVAFIRLTNEEKKELMRRFRFKKIDTSNISKYYFNFFDNEIKDSRSPISIQSILPKNIGLDVIYQYTRPYAKVSLDLSTTILFEKSFDLECDDLKDHYCYTHMLFDNSSDILMLVEEINHDGP